MLNVEHFARRSFDVVGARVTVENIDDVAQWCEGDVLEDTTSDNPSTHPRYVKVRVLNPLTERQTKAYVGDWVLYAGKGYKVYTDKAFRKSFEQKPQNLFESGPGTQSAAVESLGSGAKSNPGGTATVG